MDDDVRAATAPAEVVSGNISELVGLLKDVSPEDLSAALFDGDGRFERSLLEALPRVLNSGVRLLQGFTESLERLPAEDAADMISSSLERIDGRAIGEALTALSRLMIKVLEHQPETFWKDRLALLAEAADSTDFGKLRKYLEYRARSNREALLGEVQLLVDRPVALINLLNLLPDYLNMAVSLVNKVFTALALPPEMATYALFKVLEEVDPGQLAEAVNAFAGFVNILRKGDLILGDGSLEFQSLASRMSEDLARGLDLEGLAQAAAGLVEYSEVAVVSLAGAALREEGGAAAAADVFILATNSAARAFRRVLGSASLLPPEVIGAIAEDLDTGLDAAELGKAADSLVALLERLVSERPALLKSLAARALSGVDRARAGRVARAVLAGGDGRGDWIGPLGAAAGRALASFNRMCKEEPGRVSELLDAAVSGIEGAEMRAAADNLAAGAADAALRHPEVVGAFLRAALKAVCRYLKGRLAALWRSKVR